MTTLEMEIAVMRWIGIRRNLVVPNVSHGMHVHECDILSLTASGYATEVEIKISKADLLADKKKTHGHRSKKIANLYFAVPEELEELALSEIPERSGLLIVKPRKRKYGHRRYTGYSVVVVRKPVRNKLASKWSEKDRLKLARLGALRILGLKERLEKMIDKNKKA
jgi:hypothetical protein